jgi:hypothetical protein
MLYGREWGKGDEVLRVAGYPYLMIRLKQI